MGPTVKKWSVRLALLALAALAVISALGLVFFQPGFP